MNVTRRNFLKGMSLSSLALSCPATLSALSNPQIKGSSTFVPSICEMCSTRCAIQARVDENGKVFITGNPLSKSTGGAVCARGGAGVNQLKDSKRLVNPLIRVGEKGENKWKEITWEEAYEFIASKLLDIKAKYGAKTVAFAAKSGFESGFINQFAYAYGSPNIFDHGSTCPSGYAIALRSVYGAGNLARDFANAKFMLNFGHNVFEGIVISYARGVASALQKGCKLVSLDPRFSVLSSKASQWLPIKPGGDAAFMLAFVHTLIFEELYDKKFVEKYTVGFDKLKESVREYSPEKMSAYCDIPAQTIISLARECAKAAPAAIIDFGHRATYSPEEIELRRAIAIANALIGNIEAKGGLFFPKGASLYNKLAGEAVAPEIKGSILPKIDPPKEARIDGVDIKGGEFSKIPRTRGIYGKVLDAALKAQPYQLHGIVMTRSNPVMTINDSKQVSEALKALDLVVCIDVYLSDSAHFADIILPESTYLERDEQFLAKNSKNPGYQVRQKVVETIGNTKPVYQIFKELAEKMELGWAFPYEDMKDYRFKQAFNHPEAMAEILDKGLVSYGIPLLARDKESVAKFIEKYPKAKDFVDEDFEFSKVLECKTQSGKIELFDEVLEATCGRGGLSFHDPKMKQDDEFYFIQGKVAVHTNGHTANVPWLSELMSNNAVWINEQVAQKMGLKKNDRIKITSKVGEQIANVLPTAGIREDTLFGYFGFGHLSPSQKRSFNKGVNASSLLEHSISPVCGTNVHTIGVKIEKI